MLVPSTSFTFCWKCGHIKIKSFLRPFLPTIGLASERWQHAGTNTDYQMQFRKKFELPQNFDYRRWFPMHMSVQLKKMEGKLRSVDLIVEVHDARIPITGRNMELFSSLYAVRPHILVMNKMDLINLNVYKKPIEDYYSKLGVQHLMWTNCKRRLRNAIKELQKTILTCLRSEPRFNRTVKTEYQIMVIGIPNVGKSSLINSMRNINLGFKPSAVAEGARPGVTTRVQNRVRVLDRPPIYVLDTPGVLCPRLGTIDDTMKLGLCNLILESATTPRYVADYLLYWLNKTGDFSYVDHFSLKQPHDSVKSLLVDMCTVNDWTHRCFIPGVGTEEKWDFDRAISGFIGFYRKGLVKDQCLDKDVLIP